MDRLNRLPPLLPATGYKTYQIVSPIPTHFKTVTCTQIGCAAQEFGWVTRVDERTDLGKAQGYYIRNNSGRRFVESIDPSGMTRFEFQAGQICFATHKQKLDRPEIYVVRDGDWRGNPFGTQPVVHSKPDFWLEDFAEHQQGIADRINRG